MTDLELMKQALDFIVATNKNSQFWLVPESNLNKTVIALRERLAQPEQEPVAWMWRFEYDDGAAFSTKEPTISIRDGVNYVPLYTSPPKSKPLTEEEINKLMADTWGCASIAPRHAPAFARAVIAKATGEKE